MATVQNPRGGSPGTPQESGPGPGPGRKRKVQTAAERPPTPPVRADTVPAGLRGQTIWVCWRWERQDGRWTKVPVSPRTLRRCDATDPANLAPFADALARVGAGRADGVGLSLSAAGLLGVDLDDSRDPDTGAIDGWAAEVVAEFDTYAEVSPSGTGVKLLAVGVKPGPRCRAGDVEMYAAGRFFTVTGAALPGVPADPQPRQEAVERLYARVFPAPGRTAPPVGYAPPPIDGTDEELLAVAFRAKNGAKVRALFDGDTSGYPSASEADLALCSLLGFYFPDPDRLDAAFRRSALYRAKWERRTDYRDRTIGKALDGRTEFYAPRGRAGRVHVGRCGSGDGGDAETGRGQPVGGDGPTIVVGPDEFRVNDAAAAALSRVTGLFQRGRLLVHVTDQAAEAGPPAGVRRPVGQPVVRELPPALVRDHLTRAAVWATVKAGKDGPEERPAHPPGWCVQAVHARGHWPGVPALEAVVTHPVLLPDGSVLAEPGYHPGTGLLLRPPPGLTLSVPEAPTRAEVDAALDQLFDVVHDFPFECPAHRSAWLAGMLTPLAWFAFEGPAPFFLTDGNVRGVGKGLLVDTIALVVLGSRFPVMSYTHDRDELRKRITALAAQGDRMVLLDNLAGPVGNDVFDAALTADHWRERLLGTNRTYDGPLHVVWYGTGNNCQLGADTGRRACPMRLETPDERPELRGGFRHPRLRQHVRENRGRLLSAALTVLRGWVAAGRPAAGLPPWGSFDGWSDVVRECVVWAGQPDPGEARQEFQGRADRDALAMADFLRSVRRLDPGCRGRTAAEIVGAAGTDAPLRAAVEDLAGRLDARPLGYRLRSFARRNFDGLFLDRAGEAGGGVRWAAYPMSEFRSGRGSAPSPGSPPDPGGDGGDGADAVCRPDATAPGRRAG